MFNRSVKSELIRRHTSIAVVEFRKLPGRLKDRRVPLPLPVLDVERAIGVVEISEPLHHKFGPLGNGVGYLKIALRPRVDTSFSHLVASSVAERPLQLTAHAIVSFNDIRSFLGIIHRISTSPRHPVRAVAK
jgi:hypothetical protein